MCLSGILALDYYDFCLDHRSVRDAIPYQFWHRVSHHHFIAILTKSLWYIFNTRNILHRRSLACWPPTSFFQILTIRIPTNQSHKVWNNQISFWENFIWYFAIIQNFFLTYIVFYSSPVYWVPIETVIGVNVLRVAVHCGERRRQANRHQTQKHLDIKKWQVTFEIFEHIIYCTELAASSRLYDGININMNRQQ